MGSLTYHDAGVNTKKGDEASAILYEAAKTTWAQNQKLRNVFSPFDDFTSGRGVDVAQLPAGTLMGMNLDGIGNKVAFAEKKKDFSTLAYDLFAMVCDDAVTKGGEPMLVGSILDVNTIDLSAIQQLASGYTAAARTAQIAIINGELAELGSRVYGAGNFNMNWGASVIWFAKQERLLTGKDVQPGDSLVGLQERGFRSNGLSLAKKILEDSFGGDWPENYVADALLPSTVYCRAVVDMFGGYDNEPQATLHGVVHITGGGIPSKLERMLRPSGLGATLSNLYEPCSLMTYCQQRGKVSDKEAYSTWNMGQGMLLASPQPELVVAVATRHGIPAQVVGVVDSQPDIRITSKGHYDTGSTLEF